ncbi:hypothetical protein T265_04087 [Opisthorchis viverrini]|uniref:Uncharacterized protein n=1 Tax=Opisthorchis viverrini TaxID=6198 RepID=A0A075A149_OPIVI|nr:hypothetical protein T265_04087 [Opisthorchis viverrini]KER29240.1 hypothetical protein T265_04087 [Opisthorchis viverrini]
MIHTKFNTTSTISIRRDKPGGDCLSKNTDTSLKAEDTINRHYISIGADDSSSEDRKKSSNCSTLSVPNCHATRRKLLKPRQGKSRGRGRVRTTDLPNGKLSHLALENKNTSRVYEGLVTQRKTSHLSPFNSFGRQISNSCPVSGLVPTRMSQNKPLLYSAGLKNNNKKEHEGWDTARLPKPRQGKSRDRGRVRTTDLSINKFAL